jgi:hypothetical protein
MPDGGFHIAELSVPITFRRRPIAIPGDLRPHWQIGVILLMLWKCGRKAKASLQKIHILNWAVRDFGRQRYLLGYLDGEVGPEDVIVRYEPGLDRALRLAVAEGLVAVVGTNQLQLTPKGSAVAQQIEAGDCLRSEKNFLGELGAQATEKRMKALMRLESLL